MEKPLDPVTDFIPNRGWIICMPGQLLLTMTKQYLTDQLVYTVCCTVYIMSNDITDDDRYVPNNKVFSSCNQAKDFDIFHHRILLIGTVHILCHTFMVIFRPPPLKTHNTVIYE
jgi:hypothetical protein